MTEPASKKTWEWESNTLSEFSNRARLWFNEICQGKTLVTLDGPLGAGKTEFVKSCVKSLSKKAAAISPTFNLHQEYDVGTFQIHHLDLYRIVHADEIDTCGFFDFVENSNSITFVEWAEKVPSHYWPRTVSLYEVQIQITDSGRRITIVEK